MAKIETIEHKTSGGFDATHIAFGLVTAGAGFLCPPDDEKHEVVVRDEDGNYGVGSGNSYSEARGNAIRDL